MPWKHSFPSWISLQLLFLQFPGRNPPELAQAPAAEQDPPGQPFPTTSTLLPSLGTQDSLGLQALYQAAWLHFFKEKW